MKELIRRLKNKPAIFYEILISSFFINLFSFISSLYVILVLNRYMAAGFDGTLITLTSGMVILVIFQIAFKILRYRLAVAVSRNDDLANAEETFALLTRIKNSELESLSPVKSSEIVESLNSIQTAYDAHGISTVADAPYAFFFLLAIFLISPLLGFLTTLGMFTVVFLDRRAVKRVKKEAEQLNFLSGSSKLTIANAIHDSETIRVFNASDYIRGLWNGKVRESSSLKSRLTLLSGRLQSYGQGAAMLMRTAIIAVGAKQAVDGHLSVGALIGVSIMSAKVMEIVTSFFKYLEIFNKAEKAAAEIEALKAMPLEADKGTGIKNYKGSLEFMDVAFSYPDSAGPLFEAVNFHLEAGNVMAVTGFNGSGKTTLARLITGILEPVRGEIRVDGVNLRQTAPTWWRRQMVYMPQEPVFLNATIRVNLSLGNPEVSFEELNNAVNMADLRGYMEKSSKGFDEMINFGGRNLPLGIRRRLALARALAVNGPLVLFDDPTDGMDAEGKMAVYNILNHFVSLNKTIVVLSNDPDIIKGAGFILNLGVKPVPYITTPV